MKNASRRGVLTPTIELWNFGSLGGLPSRHFGNVSVIFTLFQKWGCDNWSIAHEGVNNLIHVFIVMSRKIQSSILFQCHIIIFCVVLCSFHVVKNPLEILVQNAPVLGKSECPLTYIAFAIWTFYVDVVISNWSNGSTISKPTMIPFIWLVSMPLLLGIPSLVIVASLFDLDVAYRLWCKCFNAFFFSIVGFEKLLYNVF
jgi:hypothetical protein